MNTWPSSYPPERTLPPYVEHRLGDPVPCCGCPLGVIRDGVPDCPCRCHDCARALVGFNPPPPRPASSKRAS